MKETKTNVNIKSLLSTIDKLNNSYFKNTPKNRIPSKQKENIPNKLHTNDNSINFYQIIIILIIVVIIII